MQNVICDFSQVGGTYLVQSDLLKEARQLKVSTGKFGKKEFRELILNRCVSNILEGMTSESILQTVLQVSDHKNKRDLQSFVTKFIQKYSFNYKKSDQDLKKLYEDLYLKFVA
jgi:regulatory protein YycI of two-component signal transduction system YycFG